MEIITALLKNQENEFSKKMQDSVPATEILEDVLTRYEKEMIDAGHSLSLAIYEFFSNPSIAKSGNSISQQYMASKQMRTDPIKKIPK